MRLVTGAMNTQITATDIIAIIIIIGSYILMGLGLNGTVSTTLAMIVGFYFGQKVEIARIKRNGE